MKQERLNSRFLKVLPMSAEESGNGGRNLNIAYSFTETPFGEILMASTSKGICYLAFVTESRDAVLDELKHIFPHAAYREHRDELQQKTVNAVLSIDKENIDVLPLHLKGTEFQLSVWKELLNIPLGGITSYGKLHRNCKSRMLVVLLALLWAIILYRYLYPVTGCCVRMVD